MKVGRLAGLAALLVAVLLAGCSRYDLYEWLIDRERGKAGLEVAEVEVDGLSISYLAREPVGPEHTLLLVHGFGGNKDNWVRMAAHIPDNYRLLIPDLAGHGDSTIAGAEAYTVEAQTDTLLAFLDALGAGSVHVAGNSMGGGITVFLASQHPDRVNTVALYDPAGSDRYPSRLDEALEEGDNPLVVREPGDFEELIGFVLEQKPLMPWPLIPVMEENAIKRQHINDSIFEAILSSAGEWSLDELLADIKAPTLIIWGQEDRVLAPENARVFADGLQNSEVVLLEDVGHVPMLEVPERSAELWLDFIRDNSAQGSGYR